MAPAHADTWAMPRPSLPQGERGSELLFACSPLSRSEDTRLSAASRLEEAIGAEFARRLVVALVAKRASAPPARSE
jgi:hypothetical protein